MEWFTFQEQIKNYDRVTGTFTTAMAYVELAMNTIVKSVLAEDYGRMRPSEALGILAPVLKKLSDHSDPEVVEISGLINDHLMVRGLDYFLFIEGDNTMPAGLLEKISTFNPEVHKIVGFPYFGRSAEDMRPIPGKWDADGKWGRLTYDEIKPMMDNPGFHEVGSVGMGCTAIHRSVFEKWPDERVPAWFRSQNDPDGFTGHDVMFCYEAKRYGLIDTVWLNTELEAGHLGEFKSSWAGYSASYEYARAGADLPTTEKSPGEVHIIVPHTGDAPKPETIEALKRETLPVDYCPLRTDTDYYELLRNLWGDKQTFITVEHDIIPFEGAIQELLDCPHDWCGFPYEYPPFGTYVGMGCGKFAAGIMKRHPRALIDISEWHDDKHPRRHWCRLDAYLKQYLAARGETQHFHAKLVGHLHNGRPAHNCISDEEAAALIANAANHVGGKR